MFLESFTLKNNVSFSFFGDRGSRSRHMALDEPMLLE